MLKHLSQRAPCGFEKNGRSKRSGLCQFQKDSNENSVSEMPFRKGLSSKCKTKGGKAGVGVTCQFPFKYKGIFYHGCPVDPEDSNERWCSTKTDDQKNHIVGGGHYGFCDSDCPIGNYFSRLETNKKPAWEGSADPVCPLRNKD